MPARAALVPNHEALLGPSPCRVIACACMLRRIPVLIANRGIEQLQTQHREQKQRRSQSRANVSSPANGQAMRRSLSQARMLNAAKPARATRVTPNSSGRTRVMPIRMPRHAQTPRQSSTRRQGPTPDADSRNDPKFTGNRSRLLKSNCSRNEASTIEIACHRHQQHPELNGQQMQMMMGGKQISCRARSRCPDQLRSGVNQIGDCARAELHGARGGAKAVCEQRNAHRRPIARVLRQRQPAEWTSRRRETKRGLAP